jgi:hypothetical protein
MEVSKEIKSEIREETLDSYRLLEPEKIGKALKEF